MARTVTLTQLINSVRLKADMVGADFCDDTEITEYINKSIAELYDLLLTTTYGDDYFVSSTNITLTGATTYSLTSNIPTFYKLKGVDIQDGGQWRTLRPFMFAERNRQRNAAIDIIDQYRYRLVGNNLQFETNAPPASGTIKVWYVPAATLLTTGSDTFDGVNGWEEYVVLDAAIKCLVKEESDVSALVKFKEDQLQRIMAAAPNRNAAEPQRVTDVNAVQNGEIYDVYGFGTGGW